MTEQTTPKFVAKRVGNVTLPLLKIAQNKTYYVRFTGDIHLGKELNGSGKVDPSTGEVLAKKQPAHVAHVDNLENEEPVQIIVATVMHKELEEAYPNQSYVGKCFEFSLVKPAGKSYNVPQLFEIEDPNPEKGAKARADFERQRAAKAALAETGGDAEKEAPADTGKGGKKK